MPKTSREERNKVVDLSLDEQHIVYEVVDDDFVLSCPMGHALIPTTFEAFLATLSTKERKGYIVNCDQCLKRVQGPSSVLHQCHKCKYDLCAKCSLQLTPAKKEQKVLCSDSTFPTVVHDKSLLADIKALEPEVGPTYIIELSKSNRAECQKCFSKIDKDEVRCGVIVEGEWGLFTKWQHLKCTIFHKSIEFAELLDGFHELSPDGRKIVRDRVEQSKYEIDSDYIPIQPDELIREEWSEKMEAPPELLALLLPYQKEGLGWMVKQEASSMAGGILADEMGMGKTIQAIALILSNKAPKQKQKLNKELVARWADSDIRHGPDAAALPKGNTLVVLPTIAIRQWESEIFRFSKEGALSVTVYHGADRSDNSMKALMDADIVITSYKILEIEYRKATAGCKVECRLCGKKFYPEKLRIHRKYFCGESAQRTEAQSKTQKKKARVTKNDVSDDDENESSEDEVSRQKRVLKDIRERGRAKKVLDSDSSSDSDFVPTQKKRSLAAGGGGKAKKSAKAASSPSFVTKKTPKKLESDSEESYCGSSDSSDEALMRKNKGKTLKSKKESKQSVKVASDSEDSDVERDIAKAVKLSKKSHSSESVLHKLSWFRIVLDEAHLIKDRSTSTSRAVFNLVSLHKWCLTGTPLQNRVGELYSLVRFLRVDPHAFYYCRTKDCDCKSLHYRFTKGRCDDCNHTAMQHFCHFNKHILNPIKRSGFVGEGKRAMLKLKDQILDELLLRRTKASRADDIELPMRIVNVRMDLLDEREEDFYQALYTQSQARFNTYVQSGTVLNNYAHIFDILIRLRQAVDHPYLVTHSETTTYASEAAVATAGKKKKGDVEETCGICHEPLEDVQAVKANCSHYFCQLCIEEYIKTVKDGEDFGEDAKVHCPVCDKLLTISLLSEEQDISAWESIRKQRKSILDRIDKTHFQSSTKVEALMQELTKMVHGDLGAKAIVFSQFVNMLDLIEFRLITGGISCVKLQGSMNIDVRDKIIKSFNENHEIKVLLISLKAGGMALNLTSANYIFLMDPWWNPAAEMQAIDRTHRLGQHKPIFATRFIIKNTIEERILKLQEKKKLVFDGTVGGDQASMARLTVDDMRFLFQ